MQTENDASILQEFGRRITRARIDVGLTQSHMAEESGVSKRTVERIEAGEPSQTINILRMLRVLGLANRFVSIFPENELRPMELLRMKGKERKRASSPRDGGHKPSEWAWKE